jgi:hypothetical protein
MKQYMMYKITCEDIPEYIYIGCTVNFRQRKCTHKTTCNKEDVIGHNRKLYTTIRENGGWENWTMSPIETYECETKIQAHMRETALMDIYKSNLNSVVSFRSEEEKKTMCQTYKQQYCKDNANTIIEKQRQYRKDNANAIIEKQRQSRQENKKAVADYQRAYREKNKDKILEYQKRYQEKLLSTDDEIKITYYRTEL